MKFRQLWAVSFVTIVVLLSVCYAQRSSSTVPVSHLTLIGEEQTPLLGTVAERPPISAPGNAYHAWGGYNPVNTAQNYNYTATSLNHDFDFPLSRRPDKNKDKLPSPRISLEGGTLALSTR